MGTPVDLVGYKSDLVLPVDVTKQFEDFGSVGNLGQNEDDEVLIENSGGYSSIGFHLLPPTGGEVTFEGSFDGINFQDISIFSVGSDLNIKQASSEDDFLGSIATLRKFRVRTSTAGSAAGTVIGRVQRDVTVVERIEFGPPPHKIGFTQKHKDISFTTAQTGASIWVPDTGNKFVVTDWLLMLWGTTSGTLKIFDGVDASGNYLFNSFVDPPNQNAVDISMTYSTPIESIAANNVLKVTTNANISFSLVVNGYEI